MVSKYNTWSIKRNKVKSGLGLTQRKNHYIYFTFKDVNIFAYT